MTLGTNKRTVQHIFTKALNSLDWHVEVCGDTQEVLSYWICCLLGSISFLWALEAVNSVNKEELYAQRKKVRSLTKEATRKKEVNILGTAERRIRSQVITYWIGKTTMMAQSLTWSIWDQQEQNWCQILRITLPIIIFTLIFLAKPQQSTIVWTRRRAPRQRFMLLVRHTAVSRGRTFSMLLLSMVKPVHDTPVLLEMSLRDSSKQDGLWNSLQKSTKRV